MYYLIQVSKDSPTATINENFAELHIPADRSDLYQKFPLSNVIRQHLSDVNVDNIFSSESLSVYEDDYIFSSAICDGGFYSYSFSCYRYFDCPFEVIEFANSIVCHPLIQFYLHLRLADIVSEFSPGSSYSISALEVKEIIDDFVRLYNLEH